MVTTFPADEKTRSDAADDKGISKYFLANVIVAPPAQVVLPGSVVIVSVVVEPPFHREALQGSSQYGINTGILLVCFTYYAPVPLYIDPHQYCQVHNINSIRPPGILRNAK